MQQLQTDFQSRDSLISYVKKLAPWAKGDPSPTEGGRQNAELKLASIDPKGYGESRNFGDGKITRLSPYIHHGILSLSEVRNFALNKCDNPQEIKKFIQEFEELLGQIENLDFYGGEPCS